MRRQHDGRLEFSKEDWKALYFAYRLLCEVARHGKPALDTFLSAMAER